MEARKQLRAWRRGECLTQTQAGAELGITKQFIGMLERGERNPGLAMANTIKRIAGIPTEAWDAPAPEADVPESPPKKAQS